MNTEIYSRFRDIPQFPKAYYRTTVDLGYLKEHLTHLDRPDMGSPLILNPEWQRGHVWNEAQKIAFMEYFLRGGETGNQIYFNCSSWQGNYNTPVFCVDGLQRITAALDFVENKIKVFGRYCNKFEDRMRMIENYFTVNILKIRNKRELLSIYYMFNAGGTPHCQSELDRVKEMIDNTGENEVL